LWENQSRLWKEVKALRLEQERMRRYMVSGFRELSKTLGVAFEDHVAAFLEETLVIGETTVSIRSIDEAEREVMKIVEEK